MTIDPWSTSPLERGLLPPYRAVLVVDMAKFSGTPSSWQPQLSAAVPDVLDAAFDRSGLAEVWKDRLFPQGTGDGYIVGFEAEQLPRLIHPFLAGLQEALEDKDRELRGLDRSLRMRLRLSIHVGPLTGTRGSRNPMDGIGKPMNDAHRLLDSAPVRALIDRTSPDVTFVAAILSQRVYEDVVEARYTTLHPHQLAAALVQVKEHESTGWLYIPKPSTNPARPAGSPPDGPAARPGAGAERSGLSVTGDVGQAIGTNYGRTEQRNVFGARRTDGEP